MLKCYTKITIENRHWSIIINVCIIDQVGDIKPSTSRTDTEEELRVLKQFDVTLEFGPCTGVYFKKSFFLNTAVYNFASPM